MDVHLADLIKEQGSSFGLCGSTVVITDRTSKRAFNVTEDLTFHEIFRDGGTVKNNKWLFCTAAKCVNSLCSNFLTCTTFAGDKDSRFGICCCFNRSVNNLHCLRRSDETLEAVME